MLSAEEMVDDFLLRSGNTATIYIGIDPGAEGAIGLISDREYAVVDIPTLSIPVTRAKKVTAKERKAGNTNKTKTVHGTTTKFNNPGIVSLFRRLRDVRSRIVIGLEIGQVQVRGRGANAYTGYKIGVGYGMWPLFLANEGYSVYEFPPSVWKKKMSLSSADKEVSRHRALTLFPQADLLRVGDHNRAEALLLAEFVRQTRGS